MTITYIILGQKGYHYCGITNQIEKRITQHNSGNSKSTRKHKPYTIIYLEQFNNRQKARIREKQIKNSGVQKWYNRNVKFKTPIVQSE